jgi:hypothetical protein
MTASPGHPFPVKAAPVARGIHAETGGLMRHFSNLFWGGTPGMRKVIFSALLLAGVAAIFAPVVFAQEEKPFTIHGEVRTRMEYTNNANDFTDSGTDPGLGSNDDQANYWPYRIRIAAEGHFAKNVSAWIELQNAGVFGGDFTGPVKNGTVFGFAADSGVSLYQGNLTLDKLWSEHFSLTFGRTELVKGNELHLGDLDFYAGIAHDGVIANWDFKKVDITGWYTRPIEGSVFHPDNSIPPGAVAVAGTPVTQYFWGAYVTWDIAKEQGLDLYFMENRNRAFVADSPTTVDMVGARWFHDNVTKNGAIFPPPGPSRRAPICRARSSRRCSAGTSRPGTSSTGRTGSTRRPPATRPLRAAVSTTRTRASVRSSPTSTTASATATGSP